MAKVGTRAIKISYDLGNLKRSIRSDLAGMLRDIFFRSSRIDAISTFWNHIRHDPDTLTS